LKTILLTCHPLNNFILFLTIHESKVKKHIYISP